MGDRLKERIEPVQEKPEVIRAAESSRIDKEDVELAAEALEATNIKLKTIWIFVTEIKSLKP
jgi:hypothetical protein